MRSKLFVPALDQNLFEKAMASAADAISFDLEDAVQEESKGKARAVLSKYLQSPGGNPTPKKVIVRVNGIDTEHFVQDMEACVWGGVDIINLPKAEDASAIHSVVEIMQRLERERGIDRPISILATIESPRGLRCAAAIASADTRVMGLQIGFGDMFLPLGIVAYEPHASQHVRVQIRMAAGEAKIAAFDGGYVDIADSEGFRRDAVAARALGFVGKTCIHPSQIETANNVFRPTDAEIELAMKVVEAAERAKQAGVGVFVVDGKLYDGPFTDRAEAIVNQARSLGLLLA